MRRPVLGTLFALACVSILVAPASGLPTIGEKHNGFSKSDEVYLHTYVKCWHAFKDECGRNLVDDGTSSGKPASDEQIEASTARMNRWLNPPAPTSAAQSSSVSVASSTPAPTSVAPAPVETGGYSIPSYIVQCESGGDYNAQNPSGAYGAYQIMPGTSAAYGCDMSSPAGQDACAAKIYAAEGASPWECG